MPALVAHIAVDLDELLEDRGVAPDALGREASRVVIMAIDVVRVLVIGVGGAKEGAAEGAGEVLDVELLVCDARLPTDTKTRDSKVTYCTP